MRILSLLFLLISLAALTGCIREPDDEFDPFEQFEKEVVIIENYLDNNNIPVVKDSIYEQLYYYIEEQGTGEIPIQESWTNLSLTGRVLGQTETFINEDSAYYKLAGLLPGMRILLPYINNGGSIQMFIPSYYGFGPEAAFEGKVPGNSVLHFEVKLNKVLGQLEYEQQIIDEYIADKNLVAEIDSTKGLRYVIIEEGDGEYPAADSRVNVDYEGKYLLDDNVFDAGNEVTFGLSNLITGWKILMPYVSEGGTIMMFIPSRYGYGTDGSGSIPPDATLIFTVTLNEVVE
ncbi:MAG: FKBP-type peptidyl-prolyl cis-trans isomerase [Cyclobacteriaceae bacterium]